MNIDEKFVSENQDMISNIITVIDRERERIAGDLHDTSLQNIAHLIHLTELCSLYMDEDIIKAKLELNIMKKILKETVDEIREIIFDLHPMTFDDLTLTAALNDLIDSFNKENKFTFHCDIENVPCENNFILSSIYRISREALNNAVKHSNAENIFYSCKCREDICYLLVQDDGIGFDIDSVKNKRHFGLELLKERIFILSGDMKIDSSPGKGTKIEIQFPINFEEVAKKITGE